MLDDPPNAPVQSLMTGPASLPLFLVAPPVLAIITHGSHFIACLFSGKAPTRLGPDARRKSCFHKVISRLRLTTYKIVRLPSRSPGFFACTIMLLDRHAEDWAGA